ncbi:MAG: thioredoxin family protein [Lewinellaceae bacterium]|nr:thioredoxin family protein [Lewinellaceae bacterium]
MRQSTPVSIFLQAATAFLLLASACSCGYSIAVSSPWRKDVQTPGSEIRFFKTDFSSRIDSARNAGLPVFIDFYTDWCGPCRVLDRDVFKDGQVASYFNGAFLNLKINAEKGEGVALARQFDVGAYPTLVFLDAKGSEKKRIVGLTTASKLKKTGRQVNESR